MAAENNTILVNDLAKVRTVDFNYQFTGSIKKLVEALGITRKIAVQEGTTLKALKVTGTLENGAVAEGELIPLSHYETEEIPEGFVYCDFVYSHDRCGHLLLCPGGAGRRFRCGLF